MRYVTDRDIFRSSLRAAIFFDFETRNTGYGVEAVPLVETAMRQPLAQTPWISLSVGAGVDELRIPMALPYHATNV